MSDRGEPLYKTRPTGPEAARFGWCSRFNEFISMSEGNSNTYMIETPEGNLLVNSGMGFEAPVHHRNFSDLVGEIDGRIRYLVTTQGHVDHVGGVRFFRDRNPGLQYVAHANNEEHQSYDERLARFRQARSAFRFTDTFVEVFEAYAAAGYTDLNPQDRPTADVTFEDRHEISLGGLDVVLIGQMGAETNDSLIVWLPEHRICLTGNLFGCPFGHFPNLVTIRGDRYRDALVCAQAARTVLDLEPEVILYGHHAPIVGADLIRREVTAFRDATLHVHDAVVKGMNDGKDLATLQQEIAVPPECEVGEGYGKVSWSVRAIWEHYAGWFKHASTTELYSVPQRAIHADLLELAGADALVERAAQKAAAGEREAALHLLDVVLSAEPDHGGAVAQAIEVHESLLEDAKTFRTTGNFWLVGWLEHQLKLLRGGRTVSLGAIIE
jgi:alkyl sulfatase BDS1-like metallo-beta-lactamase superfamily hydrolase